MKRIFFLLFALFVAVAAYAADKLPKKVDKARQSLVSILTYKSGELQGDGTAFFVGGKGDIVISYMLAGRADSIVVIDTKGKVHPVVGIVGLNNIYDCVRMRVTADKKTASLPLCRNAVSAGDELYMLAYGKKSSGEVKKVCVAAVDSLYSNAYYTLDIKMQENYESLPLVNAEGELVAIMQPMTAGDTCSYAIASTVYEELVTTAVNYGRGYYPDMHGIPTLLPEEKDVALSCMYMQAVMGDSASYGRVVNEFIDAFPKSYEGYMSKAEFLAVYCRDIEAADAQWEKSLSLIEKPAEVYFNKAKVLQSIMNSGDTVSHPNLSMGNVVALLDKAIAIDSLPIYLYYKADRLFEAGRYDEAYGCYMSLVGADIEQDGVYVNASQCQQMMKNYDAAIVLMDSAVSRALERSVDDALPLVFSRGLMKDSVGRYREAVMDYNFYEKNSVYRLGAYFYYVRSQAEVKCKMYQQALNDLEAAISQAPEYPLYHFEKGLLCYRLNMLDDAVAALTAAKELAPEASDVYYLLGCTYSKAGSREPAEENLKKALSLGHPDAANKLAELDK